MEKIKRIIESKKSLKLICGAGNENYKEIEKLSYIYSKSGFNIIDVCAKHEAINAAKKGIERAGKEIDTAICVSIGLQDDIHLTKAVINKQKCTNCKECINICREDAIYFEDERINIDEKKCIGCRKCNKICKEKAIIFENKYKNPHEMLLPLLSDNIDCIEFHCSSRDEKNIYDSWNKIRSIYNGVIGVCLDRSQLGDEQIIKILKKFTENMPEIIIQADGKPMTGGKDDLKSTLQCVSFGEVIRNAGLNNFLILSGGTNTKTSYLANITGVKINGVALGSYARNIVKEYLRDDFFINKELQDKAIKKATELASELIKYL